jgi:CDP-diacylglycerol--glycerol-3-phosphate 3-phosphatidyltransferase
VPLNTANLLTLGRIVLVPVMIFLLLREETGPLPAAEVVFGIAALTDAADGHIARTRNMITKFGRLADPLADKLLVGAALTTLVVIDRLAIWIALVVLLREVGVTALRWHAARRGVVIAVSALGKAKTGVQMTTIVMLMLVPDPGAAWVHAILLGVVAITVASGLQYALAYARRPAARSTPAVGVTG